LTVTEYHVLPWRSRLGYRLLRNPMVMFASAYRRDDHRSADRAKERVSDGDAA